MQLDITTNSIPVFQALDSKIRLQILQLISEDNYSITELAEKLHISKAIVTKHVQKLEQAQIVKSTYVDSTGGRKKIAHLVVDNIQISFPSKVYHSYRAYDKSTRVGNYTGFEVRPTCGLVSTTEKIGNFDDPHSFVDNKRACAALLWFAEGYVEYLVPNMLKRDEKPKLLEISMELASEFPYSNNIWPSDISFYINEVFVGTWTCPGNFSDARGFYTPKWWNDELSQYGLLKHLRISDLNSTMDGEDISTVRIKDLKLNDHKFIRLRIASPMSAEHKGGVTIFGKGFGNYDQDINTRLYFE